jgi:hypothetical protein
MDGLLENLPIPLSSSETSLKEKVTYVGTAKDEEESALDPDKSSDGYNDEDEKPLFVNREPVITSGRDVSKYLVDLRDDEDPPFTFRSVVLGTMVGGLGAALYQVCTLALESVTAVPQPHFQIYIYKPFSVGISTVFLLIIIYSLGVFWSTFFPRSSWVKGTRFEWLGPTLHFINPGGFKLKEVRFSPLGLSALLSQKCSISSRALLLRAHHTAARPSSTFPCRQ